jgi:hypothetical protein
LPRKSISSETAHESQQQQISAAAHAYYAPEREEHLKVEQCLRRRDLLLYNLKTVRAYLLKEAFSSFGTTTPQPGLASSSMNGVVR